jgi:chromosome segregation ATPase
MRNYGMTDILTIRFDGPDFTRAINDDIVLDRLEKTNFDLKMKVYFLEEKIKKFSNMTEEELVHDDVAASSLRLQIEQKQAELDHKNVLLGKAKSAIEQLKHELEHYRAADTLQSDLENRLNGLKTGSEALEEEFNKQLKEQDHQIKELKQEVDDKTFLINQLEDSLVSDLPFLPYGHRVMW